MLGLLIFALASLRRGAHVPAAVAFAGLLCLKHLFLTIAPFFGVYLLRAHVAPGPVVQRFLELGLAAGLTAVACVSPLLGPAAAAGRAPAAFRELLGRLFPFGDRGLVHSYWAPNAWALYVFLDRVLAKAAGRGGGGATRGLVETKVEVLPGPGPKACLALTLFAQLPALLALARARDVSSVRKLAYSCCADMPQTGRGDAVAATWIFRGDEATPRLRRGNSVEIGARLRYPAAAHTALAAFLFGWRGARVVGKGVLVAVGVTRRHGISTSRPRRRRDP